MDSPGHGSAAQRPARRLAQRPLPRPRNPDALANALQRERAANSHRIR